MNNSKSTLELMHDICAPRKTDLGVALNKMQRTTTHCALFDNKLCITVEATDEKQADIIARQWAKDRGIKWTVCFVNEVKEAI